MRYRLDRKQAEMFARAIMPELYKRQYILDSYRGISNIRRTAAGKVQDYSLGSQNFERYGMIGEKSALSLSPIH